MRTGTGTPTIDRELSTLAARFCQAAGTDLSTVLAALTIDRPTTAVPIALRAGWDSPDMTVPTDTALELGEDTP